MTTRTEEIGHAERRALGKMLFQSGKSPDSIIDLQHAMQRETYRQISIHILFQVDLLQHQQGIEVALLRAARQCSNTYWREGARNRLRPEEAV